MLSFLACAYLLSGDRTAPPSAGVSVESGPESTLGHDVGTSSPTCRTPNLLIKGPSYELPLQAGSASLNPNSCPIGPTTITHQTETIPDGPRIATQTAGYDVSTCGGRTG